MIAQLHFTPSIRHEVVYCLQLEFSIFTITMVPDSAFLDHIYWVINRSLCVRKACLAEVQFLLKFLFYYQSASGRNYHICNLLQK
jgi:hypothetical protein